MNDDRDGTSGGSSTGKGEVLDVRACPAAPPDPDSVIQRAASPAVTRANSSAAGAKRAA
jgi:hypothetical protein